MTTSTVLSNSSPGYIEEVAAYIRVSTQEQKLHGISLEAQEEKLRDYERRGDIVYFLRKKNYAVV